MNPLRPAFRTSCKFMPKPRATTEHCRRARAIARLSLMYGCVKLRPKRIPMVRAVGGENNPLKERTRARTKRIFARTGIDCEKNIRPDTGWASKNLNLSLNVAVPFGCGAKSGPRTVVEIPTDAIFRFLSRAERR